MPFAETPNGQIYYAEYKHDEATVPPLILVHGAGGSRLDWPREVRRLPDTWVIVPDLPGHGKSPEPGRNSVEAYAQDIIALADALNIETFIAAGHSMGGAIAQTIALDYGDRLTGVVLVGTGAKLRVHTTILDQILSVQSEVANVLREWIWGPVATDDMRDLTYGKFMAMPASVAYGDYLACNRFDVMDRVHNITVPALIISATHDKMTPLKYSQYLHEKIADSELLVVQDAGHMMTVEEPIIVAEAIADWIKRRVES